LGLLEVAGRIEDSAVLDEDRLCIHGGDYNAAAGIFDFCVSIFGQAG